MHAEPGGVVFGSFQFELMLWGFDGELAFEEFVEQGRQLRRAVHMHVANLRHLHFHRFVRKHVHVIAHKVILMHVVRFDVGLHFTEDTEQVSLLFFINEIHGNGVAAQDRAVAHRR
ncbi:hypothetical protein D3C86_1969210 [compost metagenome]